jgi:hypothetical protein
MGTKAWVLLNSKNIPALRMPAMIAVGKYIHMVGGCTDPFLNTPTSSHYIYNNDTDTWLTSGVTIPKALGDGFNIPSLNNTGYQMTPVCPQPKLKHWYDSALGINKLILYSGVDNTPTQTFTSSGSFNKNVYVLNLDINGLPASGAVWETFFTINFTDVPSNHPTSIELYKNISGVWKAYIFQGNYVKSSPCYINELSDLVGIYNSNKGSTQTPTSIKDIRLRSNNPNAYYIITINTAMIGDTIYYKMHGSIQDTTIYTITTSSASAVYDLYGNNVVYSFNVNTPDVLNVNIHYLLGTVGQVGFGIPTNPWFIFGKYVVLDNSRFSSGILGISLYNSYQQPNPSYIFDILGKIPTSINTSNYNDVNLKSYQHGLCTNNHEIFCYGGFSNTAYPNLTTDFQNKFMKMTWKLTAPTINSLSLSGNNPLINFTDTSTDEQFFIIEKRELESDIWTNAFTDQRELSTNSTIGTGGVYNIVLTDIDVLTAPNYFFRVKSKRVDI